MGYSSKKWEVSLEEIYYLRQRSELEKCGIVGSLPWYGLVRHDRVAPVDEFGKLFISITGRGLLNLNYAIQADCAPDFLIFPYSLTVEYWAPNNMFNSSCAKRQLSLSLI